MMKIFQTLFRTCGILLVLFASGTGISADSKKNTASIRASNYTDTEKDVLIAALNAAENENLFPELLVNRVEEGSAKNMPFELVRAAVLSEIEKARWIKEFTAGTAVKKLVIPYDKASAESLLLILNNRLARADILYFYDLSEGRLEKGEFLRALNGISLLYRKNISPELSKNIFTAVYATGKNFTYLSRIIKLLAPLDKKSIETSRLLIMKAINENRSLRELEEELSGTVEKAAGRNRAGSPAQDEAGEGLRKSGTSR